MKRLILRKPNFLCLVAALLLTLSIISQANAAMMTYVVSFSAADFTDWQGGPPPVDPPVDPVIGSFTVTFDPTVNVGEDETSGISGSINIDLDSQLAFNHSDSLSIGTLPVGFVSSDTDNFSLVIENFNTTPYFNPERMWYSQSGASLYRATTVSGTVAPVPLPAALLLLGSGLLRLGVYMRRKKN